MRLHVPTSRSAFCTLKRGAVAGLAIIDVRHAKPSADAAFEDAIRRDIRRGARTFIDIVRIEAK